jgi:hypothetical protein
MTLPWKRLPYMCCHGMAFPQSYLGSNVVYVPTRSFQSRSQVAHHMTKKDKVSSETPFPSHTALDYAPFCIRSTWMQKNP